MCKTNLICHKIKFPAHLVVVSQASAAKWTNGLMDSRQQTNLGTAQTTQRFVQIACDLPMHFDDDVANVNSNSVLAIFLSSDADADAELWAKILRANKSILKTVINVVSYFWQFNALHVWKSAKTNSPNRRKMKSKKKRKYRKKIGKGVGWFV